MKIKLVSVECSVLGVHFTKFTSVEEIIRCVSSILTVGNGLEKSKKIGTAVVVMFHEEYCGLYIPRSYRFFLDMPLFRVEEYLRIELSHTHLV